MWRVSILVYAGYFFQAAAAIIILLLGTSFSQRQRTRYPILRKLDGKQIRFGSVAVIFLAVGYFLSAYKEVYVAKQSFTQQEGPGTSQAVIATQGAFDLELLEAATERVKIAREHFASAQRLFNGGQYASAIAQYRSSIAALPTLSAFLNLGISLRWISEFHEASRILRVGLHLAQQKKQMAFEANLLFQLGSVEDQLGELAGAEADLGGALSRFQEQKDLTGEANASLNLSLFYERRGKFAEAKRLSERARVLYAQTDNKLGLANIAHNDAVDEMQKSNVPSALTKFIQVLRMYREIGHKIGEARTRIRLGMCLSSLGRLQEAEREYDEARLVSESIDSKELQLTSSAALAETLLREKKTVQGLQAAERALTVAKEIGSPQGEMGALLISANGLLYQKDFSAAMERVDRALAISNATSDATGRRSALFLKGRILLEMGKPSESIALFSEALSAAKAADDGESIAEASRGLGEALIATGQSAKGLEYLHDADSIYSRLGIKLEGVKQVKDLIRAAEEKMKKKFP